MDPFTWAFLGSIFTGVMSFLGGKGNEQLFYEQLAAAERENERARENYNANYDRYIGMFNEAVAADIARRQPMIDSVATLGPGINNLLGFDTPAGTSWAPGPVTTPEGRPTDEPTDYDGGGRVDPDDGYTRSDDDEENKKNCIEGGGRWVDGVDGARGTCHKPTNHPDKASCEAAGLTWTENEEGGFCSSEPVPRPSDDDEHKRMCEQAGNVWLDDKKKCVPGYKGDPDCEKRGGVLVNGVCQEPVSEHKTKEACEAAGLTWDDATGCSRKPVPRTQKACEAGGGTWNAATKTCTPAGQQQQCPTGQYWHAGDKKCYHKGPTCPEGFVFKAAAGGCVPETPPQPGPQGTSTDSGAAGCPAGQTRAPNGNCEPTPTACPSGPYYWDGTKFVCGTKPAGTTPTGGGGGGGAGGGGRTPVARSAYAMGAGGMSQLGATPAATAGAINSLLA